MSTIIYTKEEMLLNYVNASNENGGWVSCSERAFEKANMIVSATALLKRFKSAENIRRQAVEKYPNLIRFNFNETTEQIIEDSEEFLNLLISKSLANGQKLSLKQIEDDEELPSITLITKCFGGLSRVRKLASTMNEDFAKLPTRKPSKSKEYFDSNRVYMINEYIKACLAVDTILSSDYSVFKRYGLTFSPASLRHYFGSIPAFREHCAKTNPEFAKLLANARKAIKK